MVNRTQQRITFRLLPEDVEQIDPPVGPIDPLKLEWPKNEVEIGFKINLCCIVLILLEPDGHYTNKLRLPKHNLGYSPLPY